MQITQSISMAFASMSIFEHAWACKNTSIKKVFMWTSIYKNHDSSNSSWDIANRRIL